MSGDSKLVKELIHEAYHFVHNRLPKKTVVRKDNHFLFSYYGKHFDLMLLSSFAKGEAQLAKDIGFSKFESEVFIDSERKNLVWLTESILNYVAKKILKVLFQGLYFYSLFLIIMKELLKNEVI